MSTDISRKLAAVKDLKRQYYVGTKQAWNYLETVDSIPQRIEDIAASIQRRQPLVTPQSVLAVCGVYDYLESIVEDVLPRAPGINKGIWVQWCCVGDLEGLETEDDYALRRATLDLTFANSPSTMPRDLYDSAALMVGARIRKVLGNRADAGLRRFVKEADDDFTPSLFARQTLLLYEADGRHYALSKCLDTEMMAEKLRRDQVLDRIEYTRPLITLWAEQRRFENADSALEHARGSYSRRKEQLDRLERLPTPEVAMDMHRRITAASADILAIAEREHRSLERYFSN